MYIACQYIHTYITLRNNINIYIIISFETYHYINNNYNNNNNNNDELNIHKIYIYMKGKI